MIKTFAAIKKTVKITKPLPHRHINTNACYVGLNVTGISLSSCKLSNFTALSLIDVMESTWLPRSCLLADKNPKDKRLRGWFLLLIDGFGICRGK